MDSLISYSGKNPQLGKNVWVAPGAFVIGAVSIGNNSNIWFNSIVRGDVEPITIGQATNIQDLTLIHTSTGKTPVIIGNYVTVGHRVILHGCEIADRVLIGMGAIVMDGAKIGENSIIGAGSLITEKTVIPAGSLAFGQPCKVQRSLTEKEIRDILWSAEHYVETARNYQNPTNVSSG